MKTAIISFSVLTVFSIFYLTALQAGTMDKISSDINKIQDACTKMNLYLVQHSAEENEKYIDDLSKKLEKNIAGIKSNLRKLDETDSLKTPVKDYIEKWNWDSIRNSLLKNDGQFLADTGYISSLLPPGKKWKTLFPIFKA